MPVVLHKSPLENGAGKIGSLPNKGGREQERHFHSKSRLRLRGAMRALIEDSIIVLLRRRRQFLDFDPLERDNDFRASFGGAVLLDREMPA